MHLDRDVELLRDRVRPKGNPAQRPQEHHGRGETFGRFGAVVAHDLGDQLDAPAYGADGAEDVGGGGDGGLGSHGGFFLCEGRGERWWVWVLFALVTETVMMDMDDTWCVLGIVDVALYGYENLRK